MKEINLPPDAPSLLESMRSIGYSLESALADLVDNSIAAKARTVFIEFRPSPIPYVALLDDGLGMSKSELEAAMRHGSTNPLLKREKHDLGRYGLGLKTASISQCRRLTVISSKSGKLNGYCWDLDRVLASKGWTLLQLNKAEIRKLPHIEQLLAQTSGTLVLWHELDRLAAGESSLELALGQRMSIARDHLSLVFHRYINPGTGRHSLKIAMNQSYLEPIDPFLLDHSATQRLAEDSFTVSGHRVTVKPFILPHLSKLSAAEITRAGGSEGLRHQQGFYVYRNQRLIIWGTWFRLGRKDELSKLARVRVDIPNDLDHLWTIDVKKSSAAPPEVVRTNLRRTVDRIRQASGRTLVFRGRQANLGLITPAWKEIADRDGVRFDINRDHPALATLLAELSISSERHLEAVLKILEQSFPSDALYARLATDLTPNRRSSPEIEYRSTIEAILEGWPTSDPTRKNFLVGLHLIEPFSAHPAIAQKLAREYSDSGTER